MFRKGIITIVALLFLSGACMVSNLEAMAKTSTKSVNYACDRECLSGFVTTYLNVWHSFKYMTARFTRLRHTAR